MKKQSVDTLDAADRAQRILDWTLFTYEQAAMLAYRGGEWNVGDPIINTDDDVCPCGCEGWYGRSRRPMAQELDSNIFSSFREPIILRCPDCETNWVGDEPCFSCGVHHEPWKMPEKDTSELFGLMPRVRMYESAQGDVVGWSEMRGQRISSATFDRESRAFS